MLIPSRGPHPFLAPPCPTPALHRNSCRQSQHTVHVPDTPVTLTRVGLAALRVEVGDVRRALALATWARGSRVSATDVVPGAGTVLFDGVDDLAALEDLVSSWPGEETTADDGPLVEVPVTYDGADLDDVAARWDTDAEGVAARLAGTELVSAFCGFAPGFAYLAGLPRHLAVPRLGTPRPRVLPGSVAVADRWCGIYPTESPGGWRLLGRTEVTLWDPAADTPALLAPGTRVRLVPA
jgi:KipI family sensor histidine kinase inhibitor